MSPMTSAERQTDEADKNQWKLFFVREVLSWENQV